MECLYLPELNRESNNIIISGEEYKHFKVLRLRDNESILASNGQGLLAELLVRNIDKRQATADIINISEQSKPSQHLSVALGILDNRDRFEFAIEKCVELGVQEFYPLVSQFTQRKSLNINRLELKAIAALKQSKRAWKMIMHEETKLNTLLKADYDVIYFADMLATGKMQAVKGNALIVVGPEGGFSDEECDLLRNTAKVQPFTLGENRLRAETALLTSVAMYNYNYL